MNSLPTDNLPHARRQRDGYAGESELDLECLAYGLRYIDADLQ